MGLATPAAPGGASGHSRLLIDHPKATARQRREGYGVVGRSWHATRIRTDGMGMTVLAINDRRQGRTEEEGLVDRPSCLQDSGESSTACCRVLSLQLRSGALSRWCHPVARRGAWWNDKRNDSTARVLARTSGVLGASPE